MVPVGQHYHPSGRLDLRSVAIMLILGTMTAVITAFVMWLWEISPIPQLLIVTPILQGLMIALALGFIVRRLQVRNPMLVGVIGFFCGALSIALVHYGHYRIMVHEADAQAREEVESSPNIPPDAKAKILQAINEHPGAFLDDFLFAQTKHTGFLGSMHFRAEQGISISHHGAGGAPIKGIGVWILWGVEALFVAGMAAAAAAKAAEPFCEECADWCQKAGDIAVLPGGLAEPLATALREDNPAQVNTLRTTPPEDPGKGMATVSIHSCPHCDQAFADIAVRVQKGRETSTKWVLKKLRISPEMAATLRTPPLPAKPATEPTPESHPTENDPDLA